MDFRCVTFSWRGTVYCARERTDRTKKKGERLPRVLSSAAAKGTKSLWSSRREKEKKEIKKGELEKERERERKRKRKSIGQREEVPEGWKRFQSSSTTAQLSLPTFQFLKWLARHSSGGSRRQPCLYNVIACASIVPTFSGVPTVPCRAVR